MSRPCGYPVHEFKTKGLVYWRTVQSNLHASYTGHYRRARDVTVRWVNIGLPGHGQDRFLSGQLRSGALFQVRAGYGNQDIEAGRNLAYEHWPW